VTFVDANIVLRFLTKQPPEQAVLARDILERGQQGALKLVLEPLMVAEVIYVLTGVYGYPLERVRSELLALLTTGAVKLEYERAVLDALTRMSEKLDFPDTYLAARARLASGEVVSFDRGFKQLEVAWLEPGGDPGQGGTEADG
jgi:predicted nucleic acid-binding protein